MPLIHDLKVFLAFCIDNFIYLLSFFRHGNHLAFAGFQWAVHTISTNLQTNREG